MNATLNPSVGLLVLRLALGTIFVAHGAQKLFGAFGGFGIEGTTRFFASLGIPMPGVMAVAVGLLEFGGGLLLIFGLLTRLVALGLAVDMLVAILTVRMRGGFFNPDGMEFELMLFAAALALFFTGPGRLSIEGRRAEPPPVPTS